MTNWYNYFLPSKHTRLTDGHLKSDLLYKKLLDHNQSTAYCCYFDLDYDSLKNEFFTGELDSDGKKIYAYLKQGEKGLPSYYAPELSFAKYEGLAKPVFNMVSFDFDHENDPNQALIDVRKFCEWLAVKDIAIFYSGSKGFHVMVPFGYFPLGINQHLPNQLKDLAKYLKQVYPTLDASIYDYSRKFRLPFSRHEKTSRVKSFVPVEYINEWPMETIIHYSENQLPFDFLSDLEIDKPRQALEILITLNEQVKRNSYDIQKEKAGSLVKPSPFESYDDKLCIKKLLTSRCEDVGRNNACLRIVNDFFRTGKTLSYTQDNIFKWADENGLPRAEASTIINNIYERGQNYNFGCQDDIKSVYCSAKCSIWKKLDPDKRPITVDQPTSASAEKIKEFELVQKILMKTFKCEFDDVKCEYSGGLICKQDQDLFYYKDNKWSALQSNDIDKIKRRINAVTKAALSIKQIDSIFKMLTIYIPSVPVGVDMYSPKPNCSNFKNGTLHLMESEEGKFSLVFKDHNPLDYLTFKIEHNYVHNPTEVNTAFLDLLDRMFSDDEDKAAKILGIQEMFGAALMPYFPHLFYLYGEASSGKSSIMMILRYLLGEESNICSVQPKDFYGFNLEIMVGKLVNIVTDVDTKRPINDDIVKQIEDRVPATIKRKNRTDITAPLPSVHIFGGNDLMTSYEGYSHAMKRRWTLFKFNKTYSGPKSRNFASKLFRDDPQGLLNFAVIGLNRLVESQGFFTEFKSSGEELEAWAQESDVVAQFLDEAVNGETEIGIDFGEHLKIERKLLWDMFSKWQEDSGYRFNNSTVRSTLYKRIVAKGYSVITVMGVRYFKGLGESSVNHTASNATGNSLDRV